MLYLDTLIHPNSIAIVGASANPAAKGYDYLKGMLEFESAVKIYPVNPKASELLGVKSYANIKDIPGNVDYAVCCIPADLSIELIKDCATKGVKVLQLYTSGFSETGEEEGVKLEQELVRCARESGIRIIGPNCIGVHYPKAGLAFARSRFSLQSGTVSGLIQSGGHAWALVSKGFLSGIRFSKVISFGNACDIDESDLLDYLADDTETTIIASYIEGVKDGRRFANVIKKAAKTKPVIIFKGGRTEAGGRAVASHTGALAGSDIVWDALFRQTRAIRVYSLDEMIDTILPFIYFPKVTGRNIGIVGIGGGASVQITDDCGSRGLAVPPLPPGIREKLKEFTPIAGSGLQNPVDTAEIWNPQNFMRTLGLVASWDKIDVLLAHALIEMTAQWQGQSVLQGIVDSILSSGKTIGKPMAVILQSYGTSTGMAVLHEVRKNFIKAGVPVYPTFAQAANAISKFIEYNNRTEK